MDLFVFLQGSVPLPSLRDSSVREGMTRAETRAEVGGDPEDVTIDWERFIAVQRWGSPEEEETALRELFAWLATIDGDWQVFHTTWDPVARRKDGRVTIEPDYRSLAA